VQEQLQAAMNTYDSANQAYKQVKANSQDKVLKKQLTTPYDYYALAGLDGEDKKLAMQDAVDRLVQESKDAKNSAAIQVDLAKYAYTFSNITAPFNGILLHEDVTTPNVVVTPQTTFTVIDPNALVFRVIVSEDQINYVTEGAKATIKLNGVAKPTDGTVIKIYPDKLTLPDGENVYQVDIASNQLAGVAKYKQNGVAFITNIYDKQVLLVPTWLILDGSHVWVEENGQNVLKQVTTGNVNGAYTEITSGLSDSDKLITSPASIARKEYLFL
jgi:multidrug efflux pump subunit AcrA (membrane-fusion protein)